MTPRPRYAYLTLSPDDRLELVVSDYQFNPAGNRLLRGDSFPLSVNRLYNPSTEQTLQGVKDALRDANAFLQGEIVTSQTLTFGETVTKKRRK